jgi:hypothetical protein
LIGERRLAIRVARVITGSERCSVLVLPQPRRRWAFFPNSIVSDFENQGAHLYRAIAKQIALIDDEARFYEERANPWLRNMLLNRGASSLLAFQQLYPHIDYTTYDPRSGADLADWLTRVLATVDIVVIDSMAPPEITRWIGELTRPHLHTFLSDIHGRIPRETDAIERIEFYTGICFSAASGDSNVTAPRPDQYLIPIEAATPAAGSRANGDAQQHIDRAAISLVNEIIRAVDETLIQSDSENG